MRIDRVMAGVAVPDVAAAEIWYERLLGRTPDARPMDGLLEWHGPGGTVQIVQDEGRAGGSLLCLRVEDLHGELNRMAGRGIDVGTVDPSSDKVWFVTLEDPYGNAVTLVQARTA